MKLPGSALFYTLLISLLVSGLLGMVLLGNYLLARRLNQGYARERAGDNLHSGVNRFLREGYLPGDSLKGQLPGLKEDRFWVQSEQWGLMGLAHCRGSYKHTHVFRSLLFGQTAPGHGLWLADPGGPLTLTGSCVLDGTLHLPGAGFRIQAPFSGKKPLQKQVQVSEPVLPPLSGFALNALRDSLNFLSLLAAAPEQLLLQNLDIDQKWDGPPFLLRSGGSLLLASGQVQGKCSVFATDSIEVSATVRLTHTLLFARNIHIRSGFSGPIQVFATEQITLDSGVNLTYPSVLYLRPPPGQNGTLLIKGNSQVEGAVVLDAEVPHPDDYLCISSGSQITGQVFASSNLELRGKVAGTVWAGSFLLRQPARTYRNFLLNASIRSDERHRPSPLAFISPTPGYRPAVWLKPPVYPSSATTLSH